MGDSILFPPTLSSSSMKITQGALALASPRKKQNKTKQKDKYKNKHMYHSMQHNSSNYSFCHNHVSLLLRKANFTHSCGL